MKKEKEFKKTENTNESLIQNIATDLKNAMGSLKDNKNNKIEVDCNVSIMSDSDDSVNDFISTGNFGINYAISGRPITGGFPVGKITEIYGAEASGKTLMSVMSMIEVQRNKGISVLIDTERSFPHEFFLRQGGKREQVLHIKPSCLEDAWTLMSKCVEVARKKNADGNVIMVWDSLSASPSKKELEDDLASHEMGERARINSMGLRKCTGMVDNQKITFIIINQTRDKIGVTYGNPETTSGGKALRFHTSLRVRVAKHAKILDSDGSKKPIGIKGSLSVTKNKVYIPDGTVEYEILYDKGINPLSGIVDIWKREGFATQNAAWTNITGTDIKFNKSTINKVFAELVEKKFKDVEFLLGMDAKNIGTEKYEVSIKNMMERLSQFTEVYETESIQREEE